MPGVVGLLGVLVLNYLRHRRGLATICATVRRHVPRWAVGPLWGALTAYLLPHLWRGYPPRTERPPDHPRAPLSP